MSNENRYKRPKYYRSGNLVELLEKPQDQNFKYIIQVIRGKDSEVN